LVYGIQHSSTGLEANIDALLQASLESRMGIGFAGEFMLCNYGLFQIDLRCWPRPAR
jgi:hypothetical protein